MKKVIGIAAVLACVAAFAFAGLDIYTGKNFTTIMLPTAIADNTGPITSLVSTAKAGPIAGLPGQGALLLSYQCTSGGADAVLAFKFYACTATNTIGSEVTSLRKTVTNAASFAVLPFTPSAAAGGWLRAIVTPSGAVTNANVGAILITE